VGAFEAPKRCDRQIWFASDEIEHITHCILVVSSTIVVDALHDIESPSSCYADACFDVCCDADACFDVSSDADASSSCHADACFDVCCDDACFDVCCDADACFDVSSDADASSGHADAWYASSCYADAWCDVFWRVVVVCH
jgi:hypothetical protein